MSPWLLLLPALAQQPASPEAGFRVDDSAGWRQEGEQLVGPDGRGVALEIEPSAPEIAGLEVKDIARERAALVVDMAERRLVAKDVEARILTSPLGEPEVLLRYHLTKGKGFEGEPPAQGLRVVRRCGPTLRLSVEGDEPDQALVLEAAAQLLWADPDCEHYNSHPYRKVSVPQDVPPPRPAAPAPAPRTDHTLAALAGLLGLGALIGAGLWARARVSPPPPRRESARPERPPAAPPVENRAPPPAPEPAAPPAAPRPLGAQGATEGVWVTPAQSRGEDPLAVAVKRLGLAVGLDQAPPPAADLPDLPQGCRALLGLYDGARFGDGWLRLLGVTEGPGLTLQALNAGLHGRLGRRFALGFFGQGTLVLLSARGDVQVASPGDRLPHLVAPDLRTFLDKLADDAMLRAQIASQSDLQLSARQLGPPGPDEVITLVEGEQKKMFILDLWEAAPGLL